MIVVEIVILYCCLVFQLSTVYCRLSVVFCFLLSTTICSSRVIFGRLSCVLYTAIHHLFTYLAPSLPSLVVYCFSVLAIWVRLRGTVYHRKCYVVCLPNRDTAGYFILSGYHHLSTVNCRHTVVYLYRLANSIYHVCLPSCAVYLPHVYIDVFLARRSNAIYRRPVAVIPV